MSYQALARRWRPASFSDHLVGQEHVVVALRHALAKGRLHHAYLFTGTRGVGKTTLARILAKALNCAEGVTPDPCGICAACIAIKEGRFPDLLEFDAASNTGIDQMREVLNSARYAPTSGRYKIYLIDEVHMLSRSAFNSMLKTLEEPPEHVKFILATTDPQKIPVTVLSRCLQFSLKKIPATTIREHLAVILTTEEIPFAEPALNIIAKAAQGSLRDALSLLDQAIAFGAGSVQTDLVSQMLGMVDQAYLGRIVQALAQCDGPALMQEAEWLDEHSASFDTALQDLASLWHQLAIYKRIPGAISTDAATQEILTTFVDCFNETELQLYYQITLQGRSDLPLAPDECSGFTMTLLRLLAFTPAKEVDHSVNRNGEIKTGDVVIKPSNMVESPKVSVQRPFAGGDSSDSNKLTTQENPQQIPPVRQDALNTPKDWENLLLQLNLPPMALRLALESEFLRQEDGLIELALPASQKHLAEKSFQDKLKQALSEHLQKLIQLKIQLMETVSSPAAQARDDRTRQEETAREAFVNDPFVQVLQEEAGAKINLATIRPI